MKTTRTTLALKVAAFVAALLSTSGTNHAGVERVEVGIDGMACPFCAYNVEKRVKKIESLPASPSVDVNLEKKMARFPWSPFERFEPEVVREAVRSAGFTPGEIIVIASGRVMATTDDDGEALRLVDDALGEIATVQRPTRDDRLASWEALRRLAKEHNEAGYTVRLFGLVREQDASEANGWSLVLRRWAPTQFGARVDLEAKKMVCQRCSLNIVESLRKVEGVIHAEADFEQDRAVVWTESPSPGVAALRQAVESAGFEVVHAHALSREQAVDVPAW